MNTCPFSVSTGLAIHETSKFAAFDFPALEGVAMWS